MKINKRIIGFKSFSTKVIVMAIGIFSVVLILMIALLAYRETRFMEENFFRRGQDMLTGVREASRIALLAEDIGRLESVASENMKHRQEILYIVFYRYDWEKMYTSVTNDSFMEELENISSEFQQQLLQNVIEWHDEVIIRNLSVGDNTLVSEFWTRISSSEIGEMEMLTGMPVEADKSDSDEVSGYICLGVSKAELTDITGRVTRDSLIAGILTLLAMSIVTAWLLKRLMAPFSELVNGVQAVAEGDMERTISVRSKDEVSRLANEFNKMVLALKERQSMLVESEYKFRSLFERIHSGILIFDRSGDILDSNPSMAKMIGFKDIQSLTSSVPMETIFKNHKDYEMLVRRIQEESDIKDLQLILKNQKTGKDIETNVSITCQRDLNGNYEYSEAFIVDITHITELEKRLLQAQKMEAVGTLAGGIAHDFNNILTIVAGRIQLLAMAPAVQNDEKLNEHLQEMEQSVERAGNLVSQILGFARKGMYRADALYLNKVAQEVRSLISKTIDRRIVINLELAPELLPIKGDEEQIFQSLLNICLNSCDAMPDGGKLTVKTGVLVSKEEVAVIDQVMPPGQYVFLEVDDTGSGMDKETISKIFDPFFTTKEVGKGTGLGMAMVHGIVSNHGGYLNVESSGGRGATITIYFPPILKEGNDQDLESIEREVQEGVSQQGDTAYSVHINDDSAVNKKIFVWDPGKIVPETKSDPIDVSSLVKGKANTILLVDDEENILKMNQAFFSAVDDYDLFTASSGEEAIEILKKHRESLDIVVLDISMPGMGGREAFRVIHELFPDLPVIIATGHARDETVNSMLEEGAVDLILKPYMGFDLLKTVNACCSRRGVET